jgi:hypothetical protein
MLVRHIDALYASTNWLLFNEIRTLRHKSVGITGASSSSYFSEVRYVIPL